MKVNIDVDSILSLLIFSLPNFAATVYKVAHAILHITPLTSSSSLHTAAVDLRTARCAPAVPPARTPLIYPPAVPMDTSPPRAPSRALSVPPAPTAPARLAMRSPRRHVRRELTRRAAPALALSAPRGTSARIRRNPLRHARVASTLTSGT